MVLDSNSLSALRESRTHMQERSKKGKKRENTEDRVRPMCVGWWAEVCM